MDKFIEHQGIAAPLMRINVDTDAIIPSKRMRSVSKNGMGSSAFYNWRYLEEDVENPDFILNLAPYRATSVLLSGKNFGCGSSREHAVWALKEFGMKAILAPSFGTIFYKNCIRNGLLPAVIEEAALYALAEKIEANPEKNCRINLQEKVVEHQGEKILFEIDPVDQETLLAGLDPITQTLLHAEQIDQFILNDRKKRRWSYIE